MSWQQTGDAEMTRRADDIVGEIAATQAARGTGCIGGLGRKRKDGTVVDGVEIFDEIKAGDIRSGGFDLNGSWAPLYTVHKRSEEHTSELQSLMRISYAVFCLKKKKTWIQLRNNYNPTT